MRRRRIVVLAIVALVVAASAGAFVLTTAIKSPAQQAAQTQPPPQTRMTAPVVRTVLTAAVLAQAVVDAPREFSPSVIGGGGGAGGSRRERPADRDQDLPPGRRLRRAGQRAVRDRRAAVLRAPGDRARLPRPAARRHRHRRDAATGRPRLARLRARRRHPRRVRPGHLGRHRGLLPGHRLHRQPDPRRQGQEGRPGGDAPARRVQLRAAAAGQDRQARRRRRIVGQGRRPAPGAGQPGPVRPAQPQQRQAGPARHDGSRSPSRAPVPPSAAG